MNYRKFLIRLFTFLGGIYYFLSFVLPERIGGVPSAKDPNVIEGGFQFAKYQEQVAIGFTLVGVMAIGLGLFNILSVHGSRVAFLRKGWSVSIALLVGLITMLIVTSMDWMATERISSRVAEVERLRDFSAKILEEQATKPSGPRNEKLSEVAVPLILQLHQEFLGNTELKAAIEKTQEQLSRISTDQEKVNAELAQQLGIVAVMMREDLTKKYQQSTTQKVYKFFFEGLFIALGAAMFSLLGFYIAAAAYRAFRIKSAESALMMTAALLVMLGQIPFGLWIWEDLPEVRLWLLQIPNAAASRAVEMGASVAGLVMAFRMWLSIESESF